ncbi:MAG: TonB-dependent receptor [Gammaproteobacteria bacterium]
MNAGNPKLKLLALGIILVNTSSLALAQQNTLESIVVTADRQQTELRNVPASISVVGGDDLDTIRATHINEDLARVPGAWISRGNGQESLTAIRSPVLSGSGSCGAFQMAQDGIPLRAVGFCNVNEMFEANTEQAGAIEVIRGPGSVLYGANAIHGAINVLSMPVSATEDSSVGLEVGPHDYTRVRGTTSNTIGANGYRASFNGTSDGGYKHDSGFEQQKLGLQHAYTSSDFKITSAFNFTNLNQETAGFITGHDAYKSENLKQVNPNPESFRDAKSYRLSSRVDWQTDLGQVSITPYYRKTDMVFMQHFNPGTPIEENGQHSLGLISMLAGKYQSLAWQAGVDMESTRGYVRETQSVPALGSAAIVATIPVGKHYDYVVDAKLVSPYAQLKYRLDDSDELSLGWRYESVKYTYDNHMLDGRTKDTGVACSFGGCRFNRPADRSDLFNNSSVQLGWIHDLNASSQIYANMSNAFRAPDTNEIYRLQSIQTVADLGSEKAHSIEAGWRGTLDKLNYGIVVFHMTKKNVILQDSNRINISGAETAHRGVEINGAYRFTQSLSLLLAMTAARHTYEGTVNPSTVNLAGLDIKTAPRSMGSAQLQWKGSNRKVELEWVHMGPYFMDETHAAKYAGHDLLNLRYQVELNAHWNYGLNVTNLLDKDYAERADYAFGVERYFVGEPRILYLNAGYHF